MFANPYFSQQYFTESYFPPLVDVEIPLPPRGGGGTTGAGPGDHFNQAPDTRERKRDFLAQARQEDKDMIVLLKAFAEVISWH